MKKVVLSISLFLILISTQIFSQSAGDYRSFQSGTWATAANWERYNGSSWVNPAPSAPTSSDGVITILNGHTMTIGATVTIDQVVINSGGQITLSSGISSTLANGTGIDLDNSGTFLNSGTLTWTGTQTVNSGGTYIHNTTSSAANALGATTNSTGSSWIYRGSSSLTPAVSTSGRTYYNLTFESTSGTWGVTVTGASALTVNGDFTLGSGVTITNQMSATNVFAGNYIVNGTMTNSTNTQVYSFTGSGKNLGGAGTNDFETASIGSSASYTLTGNITVASTFTFTNNGILDCGSTNTISGAGAFTNSSTGTFKTGHASGVSGSLTVSDTKTWNNGWKIEFNGTGAQNTGLTGIGNLGAGSATITVSNTGGTVTLNSNFNSGNTFSFVTNANTTFDAGTQTITLGASSSATIAGTFKTANTNGFSGGAGTTFINTNTPTITLTGSTIEYNSGSAQTLTSRNDYANLTVSGAGTKTADGNVSMSGNLNLTGTLADGGFQFIVQGNITGTGTHTGSGEIQKENSGTVSAIITSNFKIYSGGTITAASGFTVTGELRLVIGTLAGNVTMANGSTVKREGGTLTATTSFPGTTNVQYTGTTDITTGNELPDNVGTLTIDAFTGSRGAVIKLNKSITASTLSMQRGFLKTATDTVLTLTSPNTNIGNSDSYVLGPLAQQLTGTGETDLYYPLGRNKFNGDGSVQNAWRVVRLRLTQTTGTQTTYTVIQTEGTPPDSGMWGASDIEAITNTRYYTVTSSASNLSAAKIRLDFKIASYFELGTTISNLLVARNHSGTWENVGGTITGDPQDSGTIESSINFTSFSHFTIGTTDGNQGLFPVELSSFISSVNRNSVSLQWQTASEINNSGFDIERKSTASEEWSKVGNVEGSGTTSESKSYLFTDRNLASGNYKYRLKQIDYNGNFEYFNLENEVVIGVPEKFELSQNYPNPFNPVTKINFSIPFDGSADLRIYDISGREIAKLVSGNITAGYHTVSFDASRFASGVYFYRMNYNGGEKAYSEIKKMVVIK